MKFLAGLLIYAILTIWIELRWAWAAFQTAVFCAAAGLAWKAALRQCLPRWHAAVWPLAAAVAWPLLQLRLGSTIYRWETWNWCLTWATCLALFLLALNAFAAAAECRRFLVVAAAFGALFAVFSVFQMYSSGGRIFWLFPSGYTENVLGTFVNRNQYAAFMELLIPVALWLAFTGGRYRLVWATAAAAMIASVIAGASRAGSALVLAEAVFCVSLAGARRLAPRRRLVGTAAALLLLAGLWTAVSGWELLWQRVQAHDPQWMRQEMLRASVAMVRDRPWLGTGMGTWPAAYPRYAAADAGLFVNQAHNDWACWAAEGGLPLVLLVAAFFALLAGPAVRSIWGLGIPVVLVHCLVDYPMQQRPALAAWVFVLAGAVAATRTARTTSSWETPAASDCCNGP